MEREEFKLSGIPCCLYGGINTKTVILEPCGHDDFSAVETQYENIVSQSGNDAFSLLAFAVRDWNRDLSPWCAPAVFGREPFGNGAQETLSFLLHELLPTVFPDGNRILLIGGYSLAAFFSLWAAYQTDRFSGVAACSPSVWFPDWDSYFLSHQIRTDYVYLSLGNREEKTRNPVFARVGDRIRMMQRFFDETGQVKSVLEWNEGNHFRDSAVRTAKGFSYLLSVLRERTTE